MYAGLLILLKNDLLAAVSETMLMPELAMHLLILEILK